MKKRIVYIIGLGRTGTTLLEVLLSNPDDIFSCGEVNRYPKRGGVPPQYAPDSDRFLFWQGVKNKMGYSDAQIEEQRKLHYRYEHHSGFHRWLLGFKSKDYQQYADFLKKFYETIFQESGSTILTDSSKYPGRGLNMSQLLDYDISYVYIQRDPVGMVRSFAKQDLEQPPKNWFAANLYYFSINVLCQLTCKRLAKKHRVVRVRYEDLINEPEKLLQQIEDGIGLDLSTTIKRVRNDEPLKVKFLFDGNRMRHQESIKLMRGQKVGKLSLADHISRLINYPIYH